MRQIPIKFRKILVSKFSPKERSVEIDVLFNDGSDKEITKKVVIDDPVALAEQIIQEIRNLEKSAHQKFTGETILDSLVTIVFNEEDKTVSKITHFFSKVCDKINEVRTCKDPSGYLGMINRINSLSLEF